MVRLCRRAAGKPRLIFPRDPYQELKPPTNTTVLNGTCAGFPRRQRVSYCHDNLVRKLGYGVVAVLRDEHQHQ
jgi:hypothetical protein